MPDPGLHFTIILPSQHPCEPTVLRLIYRVKKTRSAEQSVTYLTAPGEDGLKWEFEPRSVSLLVPSMGWLSMLTLQLGAALEDTRD